MRIRVQLPDIDSKEVEVIQQCLQFLGILLPGAADHIHQMHADRIPGRVHPGGEPVGKAPALIPDMHGAVEQRRLSGVFLFTWMPNIVLSLFAREIAPPL